MNLTINLRKLLQKYTLKKKAQKRQQEIWTFIDLKLL